MKICTALIFSALALAGCEEQACPNGSMDDCKAQKAIQVRLENPIYGVRAYHDDSRSVTCWMTNDPRGGLSCLPDWMLTSPEVRP